MATENSLKITIQSTTTPPLETTEENNQETKEKYKISVMKLVA